MSGMPRRCFWNKLILILFIFFLIKNNLNNYKVSKMKEREIKIKIKESDINDSDGGINGSFECPRCERGIVMIGKVNEIKFPSGILASNKYGEQIFYHYTCDRCDFKILVQDEKDLESITN
jgi:hypothetical protein